MDFDPRDSDSRQRDRNEERHHVEPSRGRRGSSHTDDRDDDWRQLATRGRDDDDHARDLGHGPGSNSRDDISGNGRRDREDARWPERDHDARGLDPRDAFVRHVDLPRGPERQIIYDTRERAYALRESETRTLSTVGAFRVVSARDLRDHHGGPADPRSGDLRHLREQGLVRTERLDGHRDHIVVLTDRGRQLLNEHRADRGHDHQQEFYAGLVKPREAEHDAQIYQAYLREAEKLAEREAQVERVVLDYELKRKYQRWLHERDADRDDANGRPDREPHEIEEWAHEHDLPYFDEQVHFPDLRIEYEEIDGRHDHADVEVLTLHYRGEHAATAARAGFSAYRGSTARIGGSGGSHSRGGGRLGGFAEELLG
jgi:DNA-binding PadR family transcriptional regulator